jgi:hypothetical protein
LGCDVIYSDICVVTFQRNLLPHYYSNISTHLPDYMVSHSKRQWFS